MNKRIERQIKQIYTTVFKQLYTIKNISALSAGSKVEILEAASLLESSAKYKRFAKKYAIALAKAGLSTKRGVWRQYFLAAKRLHYVALPKTFTEYEAKVMSRAIKENFTMIKSIPRRTLTLLEHRYTSTLIEEVAKGVLSRGSFKKELEKHGHKNAGVIARTETAKLQTTIVESRATEIGSIAYSWLSSNDRRTRPSHKEMNSVIVFWREDAQKPLIDKMRGNAGEFPNCRCSPQPIVDFDDLTSSTYKVYDYRSDKIITLIKRDLILALQRGFLQ